MGGRFENLLSFLKMAGPFSQVINDQPLRLDLLKIGDVSYLIFLSGPGFPVSPSEGELRGSNSRQDIFWSIVKQGREVLVEYVL